MKMLLSDFMNKNPERFNREFIMSRDDNMIIDEINAVFESLRIIPGFDYDPKDIKLLTDESTFGPIKLEGNYYKQTLESRFNRVSFKVTVDGRNIYKEIVVPKTLHNTYILNEGKRYFMVWQIVDSLTFGYGTGVTFKNNHNPISLETQGKYIIEPVWGYDKPINCEDLQVKIFGAIISPLLLMFMKFSLDSLINNDMRYINDLNEYLEYKDATIVDKLSNFLGVDIRFADDPDDLIEDGRVIIRTFDGDNTGISYSIPKNIVEDDNGKLIISFINHIKSQLKTKKNKSKQLFTYDDLITPAFWIKKFGSIFNTSTDIYKEHEKVNSVATSIDRLIGESLKRRAHIPKEDKENTYTIIRWLLKNFNVLRFNETQDLENKRVRLYEYLVYPLYEYFNTRVTQILNTTTKSNVDIEKMFISLPPMYLVQKAISSELLLLFDTSNEINLFGSLLRWTLHGPQGYDDKVSLAQCSLHPSYRGRISLIGATPNKPGTVGTFTPWLELYPGGFFKEMQIE